MGAESAGAQEPASPPPTPPSDEAVRVAALSRLDSLSAAQNDSPEDVALRLDRIRTMYFLSVSDEGWIEQALDEIHLLVRDSVAGPTEPAVVARAYAGALEVVRGKHAFWPRGKWRHVQDGLSALDVLVDQHPDEPEVRYLRLVSCYYLPFFFSRGESTEADLAHLLSSLPTTKGVLSDHAYGLVVSFVLEASEDPAAEDAVVADLRSTLREVGASSEDGPPGS